uniref:Uncharacterized protein n=1 Tax=Corvus moneduloides TaxID=1196302 RepID=A0A8C3H2C8_CORMO
AGRGTRRGIRLCAVIKAVLIQSNINSTDQRRPQRHRSAQVKFSTANAEAVPAHTASPRWGSAGPQPGLDGTKGKAAFLPFLPSSLQEQAQAEGWKSEFIR